MFESEQFIGECRAALGESDVHGAITEIVKKAVSEPGQVIRALGEPQLAGVDTIFRAPDLTILNIRWGPHMSQGRSFAHWESRNWPASTRYTGRLTLRFSISAGVLTWTFIRTITECGR